MADNHYEQEISIFLIHQPTTHHHLDVFLFLLPLPLNFPGSWYSPFLMLHHQEPTDFILMEGIAVHRLSADANDNTSCASVRCNCIQRGRCWLKNMRPTSSRRASQSCLFPLVWDVLYGVKYHIEHANKFIICQQRGIIYRLPPLGKINQRNLQDQISIRRV